MPTENRSSSTEHALKIHEDPFAELLSGAKTCEVRKDDRGFAVGDTVQLHECGDANYTGRTLRRTITHIQRGYGLPEDMCVLSYAQPAAQHQGEPVAYRWEQLGGRGYCYGENLPAIIIGAWQELYTHPPTADGFSAGDMADQGAKAFREGQRALVLPDRMGESTKGNGWNACLDEIRRLNEACITPE
ncbi:hypothetical protein D3C77_251390 [compost metagenome]